MRLTITHNYPRSDITYMFTRTGSRPVPFITRLVNPAFIEASTHDDEIVLLSDITFLDTSLAAYQFELVAHKVEIPWGVVNVLTSRIGESDHGLGRFGRTQEGCSCAVVGGCAPLHHSCNSPHRSFLFHYQRPVVCLCSPRPAPGSNSIRLALHPGSTPTGNIGCYPLLKPFNIGSLHGIARIRRPKGR